MSSGAEQFGGNRGMKFVYYRDLRTGHTDEMNWWEWENAQKDPELKTRFELIRVVDLGQSIQERQQEKVVAVEEDPLQCPLCGMVAKTETSLKQHKTKKHG